MSKPRYKWWGYVKNMIRAYPGLKREYEALHEQSVTANVSGMPGSGTVSRGTEDIAVRELPYTRQREYEAVRRAVEYTKRFKNGEDRLKIIDLIYWKNSHTLAGAGLKVGYGYDRAKQIHREFIIAVAVSYGLMDVEQSQNITQQSQKAVLK
jgi:hypothetical protein